MEAFVALDVAIGLAFMYLLLALLCTALNEWVAGLFRLRAKTLKTAVSRLVDNPPAKSAKQVTEGDRLSTKVFEHPLIVSLKDGERGPSYIPAPRFVAALKDTMEELGAPLNAESAERRRGATKGAARSDQPFAYDVEHVTKQFAALRGTPAPRMRAAGPGQTVDGSSHDDDDRLEEWFNQGMERASGWYKRRVMIITMILAILATVVSNADTLIAARILWRNPAIRAAVITQAQERAKRPRPTGGVLQADYPDKDKPVSETASAGEQTESAEREGLTDESVPADTGLTAEEEAALGQIIG